MKDHTITYTAAERELTQLLVTELLAHQFCFPVQWIETQKTILGSMSTERLVEIGPAETLLNMAKKTIKADYEPRDTATGLKRELLSYKKNSDTIYYKADCEDAPTPKPNETPQTMAPSLTVTPAPVPTISPPPLPAPASSPAIMTPPSSETAALPDKPLTALDILTVLTAVALRKTSSDIPPDQSIKKLCGGKSAHFHYCRSTVQNEIIGDLSKEFGDLPEQPEDMPLREVAVYLTDAGHGTKFGPCSNALAAKFANSKMVAGTTLANMRQYLGSRWNLKQGLQDRSLLHAVSSQPASRLASEAQTRAFFDEMATATLKSLGMDPTAFTISNDSVSGAGTTAAATIPPQALQALQNEQREHDKRLMDVYARRCGIDLSDISHTTQKQAVIDELQARVDAWSSEHSSDYELGIQSKFESSKARIYDSSWNWVIQDLVITFAGMMSGQPTKSDMQRFTTRMTEKLVDAVLYLQKTLEAFPETSSKSLTKAWLGHLRHECDLAKGKSQSFRFSVPSKLPVLHIDEKGMVSVDEIPREVINDPGATQSPRTQFSVHIDAASEASSSSSSQSTAARSDIFSALGNSPPTQWGLSRSEATSVDLDTTLVADIVPHVDPAVMAGSSLVDLSHRYPNMPSLKIKSSSGFEHNGTLTDSYLQWFDHASRHGISFSGMHILVTGAGKSSIGAEVVKQLLSASARVIVTTSSYSPETVAFYEDLYKSNGGADSQLVVVPFNSASSQDAQRLVSYIYTDLGWDLDRVVPFAAIGEGGRDISEIDGRSELAHRAMLTNVLRLLGNIKDAKAARGLDTHPTQVIVPLSPNHGGFGNDGLYSESKIGLETLVSKWGSETWSGYLSICGAVIGWVRGTNLMQGNDIAATGIEEELQIRTFCQAEMAWHLVGLMDPRISDECEIGPVVADLSGGMTAEMDMRKAVDGIRESIRKRSELRQALAKEAALEQDDNDGNASLESVKPKLGLRARIKVENEPRVLPKWEEAKPLHQLLEGMVDLERVVVVVGFGEAGPCGSARTRWEAETGGTFSITGCLELAWIMGLVKYHNGSLKGQDYCGWIDVETNAPISDTQIKGKYEAYMIQHTGIRVVERQSHDLTDPSRTQILHEVSVTEDLEPFEVSIETAESLRREHGEKVTVVPTPDGDNASVTMRKGVTLLIPKSVSARGTIGAQMPTGWDARRYGIPDDIIAQVDPVTLYALVSTVEAFLSAGITDPYELYEHMHVSDMGNAVGTSLGGLKSLHDMFKQRFLDRQVQKDILAETFVNTTAAWVNMLLLGASGPIRTPVGACATSLESVDTGYDLIMNGKAKAVLVGGTDYLERDIAAEFSNMQATIDATKDAARGRTPKQGSRPTTSSRAGFVEGEGCGIQLLTTARLALDMGLPIQCIIALTHTAADGIGRSVPAPGKGVLTAATEKPASSSSPAATLDLASRRRRLHRRQRQIDAKRDMDLRWINSLVNPAASDMDSDSLGHDMMSPMTPLSASVTCPETMSAYVTSQIEQVNAEAARSHKEALNTYGNGFYRSTNGSVAPLRGALAVWGLSVDDVDVASLHGTSTVMNDINETSVIESQLTRLGRTKGNLLPCVAQKSLLGHGKGAAGAFALNGCLQMLKSSVIPGNHNADNIDPVLADREHMFFPSKTYTSPRALRAFSVTSFGFGQKGAQVVGVNARYVLATISEDEFLAYEKKVSARLRQADARLQEGMCTGKLVILKEEGMFKKSELEHALLNRS